MRVKIWENKSFSGHRPLINGTFIFFINKNLIAELVSQLPKYLIRNGAYNNSCANAEKVYKYIAHTRGTSLGKYLYILVAAGGKQSEKENIYNTPVKFFRLFKQQRKGKEHRKHHKFGKMRRFSYPESYRVIVIYKQRL